MGGSNVGARWLLGAGCRGNCKESCTYIHVQLTVNGNDHATVYR